MQKALFSIVVLSLLIVLSSNISALITCNPNPVNFVTIVNQGGSTLVSCSNNANQSVVVSTSGSYISIVNTNTILPLETKNLNISFSTSAPQGTHVASLLFSDSSNPVGVFLVVNATQQQTSQS
ncbi:MAG: hypothetical protein AABY22_23730, partial [Nanoarchaeota archaeon]